MGKFDKVKKHLKSNKQVYVGVVAGAIIGAVTVVVLNRTEAFVITDSLKLQVLSPTTNNITTVLERRGHPGNIIKCKETGEIFGSQERAADVMGINASNLSRHLRGDMAHVKGYTFENLGENV